MKLLLVPIGLLLFGGCTDSSVFLGGASGPSDRTVDPGACGFEDGDLAGFGHPGETSLRPEEGGKVEIVEEGDDFSALVGEEDLWFHGTRALLLRSNDQGDATSLGVITTSPFVPEGDVFVVDQLSEVGPEGIDLELRILDAASGDVLEQVDVPVRTGGYIPELGPGHSEIDGFPEITFFGGAEGEFVRDTFDISAYREEGLPVRVQLRQHTVADGNGFFTLLDNLCDGVPADPTGGA